MPFKHIISAFYFEPWGIRPESHAALGQVLQRHLTGDKLPTETELLASVQPDPQLQEWRTCGQAVVGPTDKDGNPIIPQMQKIGSVAVIPVFGTLGRHLSFFALWCGGCDYSHIEQMAQLAEADPMIKTIVFYFRTPGGMVMGCEECATYLASLTKKSIGFTDELCCSCGEWLAAALDEFYCAPSSMVGCVGIFSACLDNSVEWEQMGWKRELFRSGPLKAAGISGKPWTDQERAMYQARTDEGFAVFSGFLKSRRPQMAEEVFDGAWFYGRKGVELGIADGLATSLEAVVAAALE